MSRVGTKSDDPKDGKEDHQRRLMHDVGWQEGIIQTVSNFMFQNRHQASYAKQS